MMKSFAQKNWPKRLTLDSIGDFKDLKDLNTGVNLDSIGSFDVNEDLNAGVNLLSVGNFKDIKFPERLTLDSVGVYDGKIESLLLETYS